MKQNNLKKPSQSINRQLFLVGLILIITLFSISFVFAWSTNIFNNSLSQENMSMIAEEWQTRWLNVPTNTYLINGYLNLTGKSLYYTNGFCGQKYTGNYVFDGYAIGYSNIVDGNWDTSHYITSGAVFTINYSKPVGATSAIWQVKFDDQGQNINNTNVTIPISCFSESVISLRIYHQTGMSPNNPFIFYCHNSSGYGTIFYKELVGQAYLYEEAMIWNNGTNNCYQEQTNISGYPHGVEVGIGDSNGYFIPTGADEDVELNLANSPNKSINLASWINSYTSLCNCVGCNLITGYCQVPFLFRSYYSNGILSYNNLIFNNIGWIENSQTYNTSTYETTSEIFKINITYDNNFYTGISSYLVYNNTNYLGTKVGSGNNILFTRTLSIPSVTTQINNTFYWNIALTNSSGTYYFNSTSYQQTVKNLGIDDCTIYTNRIMNISLFDEEFKTYLPSSGSNIEVELTYSNPNNPNLYLSYFNNFTNRNNLSICMENLTYGNSLDTTIRYNSVGYTTEYYYIDNHIVTSGELPLIINLYDLNESTPSTSYLNTYKNCNYLTVGNAIIETWRKYVSEGQFYLVEMSKTNEVGQAVTHLVSEDIIYKYLIRKDGVLQYQTDEFPALCIDTPCQINIVQKGSYCGQEGFTGWQSDTSITYDFNFNETTKVLTFDYSTVDGSPATLSLTVMRFDQYLNSTFCSQSLTSAGGTLTCTLTTTLTNSTYYAEVTKNGNFVTSMFINLNTDFSDVFGLDGILYTFLLILVLCLIGIPTGWGTVVFLLIGFIISSTLSLIAWNWTLFIYLAVACIILIIKLTKKQDSG